MNNINVTALPRVAQPSQLVGCIPDGLPVPDPKTFGELDTALTRYYVLNDIVDGDVVGEEQAAEDRIQFAHLRTPGAVDFHSTVDFMHAASDLPRDWCVTWVYLDEFAQVQAGVVPFQDLRSREEYIETTRLVAAGELKAARRNGDL